MELSMEEELQKRIAELEAQLARSKEAHRWALDRIQAAKAEHAKAQAEVTAMIQRYEPKRIRETEIHGRGISRKVLPRMLPPRWLLPVVAAVSAALGASGMALLGG